jgi:hypothetical protein
VIVSGYSFSDYDLNEMLFDAATRRERSEFVAFCHSHIPDSLAERAATTPNLQVAGGRQAIIGGVRGEWKPPEDIPPGLWDDGQFSLGDFRNLATYLARSATREPEGNAVVGDLVAKAVTKRDVDAGS